MSPARRKSVGQGDHVKLRVELIGKLPDQTAGYRALPGVEADVLDVNERGQLVLRVGKYDARCLADQTDVELVKR